MFKRLAHKPGEFAVAMALEIALRAVSLDAAEPELEQFRSNLSYAASTTIYSTRAKALLTRPLKSKKITVDGTDWRACVINLYSLWQGITMAEVEQRMASLREQYKDNWRKMFPDDWDIDEQKLQALYKSSPALLVNGLHDLNDISLALRFFVAEQLAIASKGQGIFDWGGSDGITCIFARHLGAKDLHVHEPNAATRNFGTWLADAIGLDDIHYHEQNPAQPPAGRRFGAGICTEVLEHVIDPRGLIRKMYDLLIPDGVLFVTSSFAVTQDTHLKQNVKYAGKEHQMMVDAGFQHCTPNAQLPMPFLPQWGFWHKPG